MIDLKAEARKRVEQAKEFNARPPYWSYWALGIVVIIIIGFLKAAF